MYLLRWKTVLRKIQSTLWGKCWTFELTSPRKGWAGLNQNHHGYHEQLKLFFIFLTTFHWCFCLMIELLMVNLHRWAPCSKDKTAECPLLFPFAHSNQFLPSLLSNLQRVLSPRFPFDISSPQLWPTVSLTAPSDELTLTACRCVFSGVLANEPC